MADKAKFLDFLDMIDGGGAGQRGDQFEGGGIFSALANLMPINPFGSEDKVRRRARDDYYEKQGITPKQAAATPAVIKALQYDAGPITQDMRPRQRTFPQSNQFIPEMPVPPSGAPATSNQFIPEMPVSPSGVMPPMPPASQDMVRPMPQVGSMPAMPQNMARPEMGAGSMPADSEFTNFLQMAKNDPMFAGMNAEALRNIYSMYKEQMAARQR
jgi:hypothetical protein